MASNIETEALASSEAVAREIRRAKNRIAQRNCRKKKSLRKPANGEDDFVNSQRRRSSQRNITDSQQLLSPFSPIESTGSSNSRLEVITSQAVEQLSSPWHFADEQVAFDFVPLEPARQCDDILTLSHRHCGSSQSPKSCSQPAGDVPMIKGRTALHIAAEHGHTAIVSLMLNSGARINCTDEDGRTALHSAAKGGHVDIVSLLVDQGADVHAVDASGWTALHIAAAFGKEQAVAIILAGGADANASVLLPDILGSNHI